MTWAYAYDVGPPGGTFVDILDFADSVRILDESTPGLRGSDPISQHVHGEVSSPRKFYSAITLSIEMQISGTNAAGAITHGDGEAGHRYENLGTMFRLFAGTQGKLVRLRRTSPHQGTVYMDMWLIDEPRPTQNRFMYRVNMRAPHPFWVGAADTGNTPTTLTVAGDAPIDDMVIDFTGGTDARLTLDATGDYIEIVGALPAGGVRVDVGTQSVTKITGGADYSNALRSLNPWWLELDPGANAVTLTGGGSVSVDWFTKWR